MYTIDSFLTIRRSFRSPNAREIITTVAAHSGVSLDVKAVSGSVLSETIFFKVKGNHMTEIERFLYYMHNLWEDGDKVGPLIVVGPEEPLPTGKEWRTRLLRFKNWVRRIGK